MRRGSGSLVRVALSTALWLAVVAPPSHASAKRPALRLRGQLMMRWSAAEQQSGWTNRFSLERARVEARWKLGKRVRLVCEFEGHDGFELKDAYGRVDPWPWLRLTAGHFKKPFSRLSSTR